MIVDAGPIIDLSRDGNALVSFLREARRTGRVLTTTDAIVAQVWRGDDEPQRSVNLARTLKAIRIERAFGDGRAIGILCADETSPDVVDASLAWWGRRLDVTIWTNDPDVARYAARAGARTTTAG